MLENNTSILAVDDDVYILRMLKRILESEGFRVSAVSSGEEALNIFGEHNPDLVLLDITMPGIDGYTVCERIREFSSKPIIMITARGSDDEIVKGLEAGADDYVVKPFSARELIARIRATMRRSRTWETKEEPVFRTGQMLIDYTANKVFVNGKDIDLTATEYRILCYLAQNAGRVITPDQILGKVWGENYSGENHILHVNIARLRRKIEENQEEPKYILTRTGIGYLMPK
jgi:DNA-binding response OmpR family regulator